MDQSLAENNLFLRHLPSHITRLSFWTFSSNAHSSIAFAIANYIHKQELVIIYTITQLHEVRQKYLTEFLHYLTFITIGKYEGKFE